MNRSAFTSALAGVVGLTIGITITNARAQDAARPQSVRDFPDLVSGLKATPGCLGVETVNAKQGKQAVILAWFKDKKAAEDWYYSKMHQDAMKKFFPNFNSNRKPLGLIKDPNAPLLVIASVTPSAKPAEGQSLAVSQIAIEMYTPAPGGLALGGSFAPEALNVEGLVRVPLK